METKDVVLELRTQKGWSQEELAQKLYVTRQAVSRWETGETLPNTETLKLLSQVFDVSINTLLGSPRQLTCQCCGKPLEDRTTGKSWWRTGGGRMRVGSCQRDLPANAKGQLNSWPLEDLNGRGGRI